MKKQNLLLIGALFTASFAAQAQVQNVTMFGALSNFDVMNDTGQQAHGFEIEIQGIDQSGVGGTFTGNRYGGAQIVPFAGGVYIRYMSPWDAASQSFTVSTPIATNFTPTMGHQCVIYTPNYNTSGCEHFGVWTYTNPTNTIYRRLLADPNNPGQLISNSTPVGIPAPSWVVLPPPQPAAPPIVAADVVAPVPPEPAFQFGDAQWMKVYKTEIARQVGLDELVADNPVDPEAANQVETSWFLVQAKIGGNGKRNQKRNQAALGVGSHAVVRRFEFFKFSGTYDPITHEAICLDGTCSAPDVTELGDFIGAQNGAANLNVPAAVALTLNTVGNGQVTGLPGVVRCSGACSANINVGTLVTLTATPASGMAFGGWSGACAGAQNVCSVTVDSAAGVTATFIQSFNLTVARSGKGTVTSNPDGIGCGVKGGSCAAKYGAGAVVTLTAVPDAGSIWTGWGGACSGTSLTCTVTITKDTPVQANFR
jgi:Divergent InlB B-repeat domain